MKNFSRRAAIVAMLITIVGCHADDPLQEEEVSVRITRIGNIITPSPAFFANETMELDLEAVKRNGKLVFKYRSIVEGTVDWKVADRELRRQPSAPSDVPDYIRQQAAASLILKGFLLRDTKIDRDELDAIAYYMEMALLHRTPDGVMITKGLDALEGHWDSDKISLSASRAQETIENFLDRKYYCEGCGGRTSPLEKKYTSVRQSNNTLIDNNLVALEQLRKLTA